MWWYETQWRPGRGHTGPCHTPRQWSSPSRCLTDDAAAPCPRRPAWWGADEEKSHNRYNDISQITVCLKKYIQAAHRMSVAVCSMLIAGGLVAAVSSGSSVHEPETHENTQLNNRGWMNHKCAASYKPNPSIWIRREGSFIHFLCSIDVSGLLTRRFSSYKGFLLVVWCIMIKTKHSETNDKLKYFKSKMEIYYQNKCAKIIQRFFVNVTHQVFDKNTGQRCHIND